MYLFTCIYLNGISKSCTHNSLIWTAITMLAGISTEPRGNPQPSGSSPQTFPLMNWEEGNIIWMWTQRGHIDEKLLGHCTLCLGHGDPVLFTVLQELIINLHTHTHVHVYQLLLIHVSYSLLLRTWLTYDWDLLWLHGHLFGGHLAVAGQGSRVKGAQSRDLMHQPSFLEPQASPQCKTQHLDRRRT